MSDNGNRETKFHADVGAQRVAQVYAEALLNAAAKHGQDGAVLEEVDSLVRDVFPAERHLEPFLASGAIGRDRKAQVIRRVFGGRASELFVNFLLVLNAHDRLDLVRPVLAAAREIANQRAGRVPVRVRTAVPLPPEQQDRLRQELRQAFHLEPLLHTEVEPGLLGGMVVRVGDWLYDASVRTRLESLRNQLIERSSHEIQSGRDRFRSANGD